MSGRDVCKRAMRSRHAAKLPRRRSTQPVRAYFSRAASSIDRYAKTGWVDLRLANFEKWRDRLGGIKQRDVERYGSAALDVKGYPGEEFIPGDIVGWIFTNEEDEQGMIGRRLF